MDIEIAICYGYSCMCGTQVTFTAAVCHTLVVVSLGFLFLFDRLLSNFVSLLHRRRKVGGGRGLGPPK